MRGQFIEKMGQQYEEDKQVHIGKKLNINHGFD